MNNIYDNGELLLGQVNKIIKYFETLVSTSDIEETTYEIIKELKEYYDKESIVCINYDLGMGYSIDEWAKNDKLKGVE